MNKILAFIVHDDLSLTLISLTYLDSEVSPIFIQVLFPFLLWVEVSNKTMRRKKKEEKVKP